MKLSFNAKRLFLGTLLLWVASCGLFGQKVMSSSAKRVSWQAGLDLNLSRPEGDAPAYLRQQASDFSTNFGTKSTYQRLWRPGYGVYGVGTVRLTNWLGIDLGARLGTFSAADGAETTYDPPSGLGLVSSKGQIKTTYLNLSPSAGIRGAWRNFSIGVGTEVNVFVTGRTTVNEEYVTTVGTTRSEAHTRLDTQDQPIYSDPLHGGGVANFTHITNRNHGANPIWFAGYARLDYRPFKDRRSPIIGIGWRIPLSELQRSNNPKWSFVSSVDPAFEKMNYGTKISTMSLHLGWAF